MASMKTQVDQFNTSQENAMRQFDTSEANAISKFNAEQKNARDEFNTENSLLIAQANAKWRQGVVTTNTATQNEVNMENAKAANGFTAKALDEVWQKERDILAFAWKTSESIADRKANILISQIAGDAKIESVNVEQEWDAWKTIANFL